MPNFASSAAPGWSEENSAVWRSCASSEACATLNVNASRKSNENQILEQGLWFYSSAQRHLAAERDAVAAASPVFGTGATTLRQRARPASTDTANIVRFDLLPSAVMTSTIGQMRKEANNRSSRLRQRMRLPLNPAHDTVESAGNSTLSMTESLLNTRDGVGRLVNVLSECNVQLGEEVLLPQQQRPNSTTRKSLRPSHNDSYAAASFAAPHVPSERSPCDSANYAVVSHIVSLTKSWVTTENQKAAGVGESVDEKGGTAAIVRMPVFRTVPTHTTPLSNVTRMMRLRKGKFEPLNSATAVTTSLSSSHSPAPSHDAPAEANDETIRSSSPDAAVSQLPQKTSNAKSSAESALEELLLSEPIRSYRLVKDATMPSLDLHPSTHIPLLKAARLRRANLERLTHNFEHQRYVLHGELEEALVWRERCRTAVLRRLSTNSSTENFDATQTHSLSVSSSPSVSASKPYSDQIYQGLLDEVFGCRAHRLPETAPALPMRSPAIVFRSMWTKEAARQALREEKERLTRLLTAFEASCGAAALTLADMEDFRAETIKRVWRPDAYTDDRSTVVFYREHFLKYVETRYASNVPTLANANAVRLPNDILEALPSKAEVSFAKYAYEVLPSCTLLA